MACTIFSAELWTKWRTGQIPRRIRSEPQALHKDLLERGVLRGPEVVWELICVLAGFIPFQDSQISMTMDFISLSLTYFCLITKRSTYFMPHLTDKPPVSFLMILLSFPLRNLFLNQIWGLIIVRVVSSLSVCLRLLFNYQIQITEIFA